MCRLVCPWHCRFVFRRNFFKIRCLTLHLLNNDTNFVAFSAAGEASPPRSGAIEIGGTWPRGEHSPGPYLEIFARRKRHGWASWGNEIANDVEMPNVVFTDGGEKPQPEK